MSQVSIEKEFVANVSFESFVKDSDCPWACACDSVDVAYWNEYCSFTNTFTVKAESPNSLDEKVMDLICAVEALSKNRKINLEYGEDEITVEGFNLENFNRRAKNHYDIHTCYGREHKNVVDFIAESLPNNYVVIEDDDGQELVLFYNTYDDLFHDIEEKDMEHYSEVFRLNPEAKKYDLEDDAYGEIVILDKDFISKYMFIED